MCYYTSLKRYTLGIFFHYKIKTTLFIGNGLHNWNNLRFTQARRLPKYSHISSYFMRRVYKTDKGNRGARAEPLALQAGV